MSLLSRVMRLASLLPHATGRRAFRTWKPFSITSYEITQRLSMADYRFSTVVDGGANAGQFARASAETWPGARVYSFEPLPALASMLRRNLQNLGQRVHIEEVALGASAGTVTFYETPYSLQSSALKPTGTTYEQITVRQARLDDLLRDASLQPPVLLKLDLQGYELEALKGATETLAKSDAVLLEAGFETSYEGEPSFEMLRAFLATHGFAFRRPVDVLWENDQITQMDALFTRADA